MLSDRKRRDKRITLAPLTTEEALRGLMEAGPHPKDADQRGKEEAPPKGRRTRKNGQGMEQSSDATGA